ncbi:MAG TPA: pilus assembly protein PilP [Thermodesulfobacteriota bacterium]|nr:pilus assembly protein PilP [Thermodesulfobacteriota bacterium]
MLRRLHIFFLAALLPFVLISCGGKEEKFSAPVHKPKAAAVTQAAEEADQKMELHELTPASKDRNPFVSYIMLLRGERAPTKIKGPLECCDVSQFKLLAVIVAQENSSALLQAPDGKRYIVKNGDLLGSRDGRIVRIKQGSLVVREKTLDEAGRVISSEEIELALPAKEEDKKPSR